MTLEGVVSIMLSSESLFLHSFAMRRLAVYVVSIGSAVILSRTGVLLPRHLKLRQKGLDLLLAGQPIEAEKCYRTALALGSKVPAEDRIRLLICLGDALFDQARYQESKQCLTEALSLGDPTGSGQGSMADLLIAQGGGPQGAIDMAEKAMALYALPSNRHFGNSWSAVFSSFQQTKGWARITQALLQLDKRTEARQAMDRALQIAASADAEVAQVSPSTSILGRLIAGNRLSNFKNLTISDAHYAIGLALFAMKDPNKAAEHFRVARDRDPKGKYRQLAQKQLEALGSWSS
jgi:tetratricopeptide (TPR) repeat protein